MKVYLVRHAEAASLGGAIRADADRPLTDAGEAVAAAMGRVLARMEPSLTMVLSSPLLRARRTGELMCMREFVSIPLRVTEHLSPGSRPKAILDEVFGIGMNATVALVGHQPDLGYLLSYLVCGEAGADVAFKPATMACISLSGSTTNFGGRLEWLLTPDLVSSLGG
jgi:phosphohistidine phosphatase